MAVLMILFYLLIPVPQVHTSTESAGLDDFTFPTVSNSRFIPILYGTVWVSGNILYYGNLQAHEIQACS